MYDAETRFAVDDSIDRLVGVADSLFVELFNRGALDANAVTGEDIDALNDALGRVHAAIAAIEAVDDLLDKVDLFDLDSAYEKATT